MELNVQEIRQEDIELVADYWQNASDEYLLGMGADPSKMPSKVDFCNMLLHQLTLPMEQRRAYCLIWWADGRAVGHSNTNPTTFGNHAFMHLHLWQNESRKKGMGVELVKLGIPHFFEKLQLKVLYCQPYAYNPAPNRVMEKVGFEFVKKYRTTPGSINLEQEVNQWRMTRKHFELSGLK